ncbi:heparinase II/III family protein [Pelagicoccus sp. SDUM812005]|uniref:heparinase II/III domain-containing protein n=1 Tax=Pelagicoccus sp. SDUM812005 TaxID=3041257 RepID=UPI00280F9CCE|nr:heparinase II/III family protein [Pelagicoccus sp. SDUM812005]MDQ8179947.1 heparinase II/III family protein [Pelagicoccus sp. SDUM812005]
MVARILSLGVAAAIAANAAFGLNEREYYYTYDGFELPSQVTMPAKEVHPSLWFSADEAAALAKKKDADDVAAAYWKELAGSEFVLAELPPIPSLVDDKKVVHKYYGTLTQVAAYNAFLYQVSNDGKKQAYLDKAVEALKRGYAGPLYQLDPIVKGSAVDEIYQGVWAQSFAAAYDWVQPALSKEDDAIIRGHLVEHTQYMYENLWSWAGSPHNHLSKPAWGLGSMALCLSDHPDAEAWLERAVAASNANTRYFFSGDGVYREGSFYYLFSFINFVPFLYHYENAAGFDGFSVFQPAFEWPIVTRNGKGWTPNIEDSFIKPYPSQLVAGAFRDKPTSLHSSAPLSEVLQWNFHSTDYSAFDKSEAKTGYNYTGASWDYPKPLMEYLCYQPDIVATQPDVSPVQFLESGQSVFRSDWNYNDPNSRTLLFQAVAEADNHEHYDHLSFILQAENQLMSSDSGYTRASYGQAIRREWYLTAEAHNVVLANGKAPGDVAPNLAPISRSRLVSPFFSCEIKTARYADGGEHQRLIAMLEGDRFAVLDQVELPAAGQVEIVMHGGRASLDVVDDLYAWSYQDDDYGSAAGLRQWFWGKGFRTKEFSGELTYIKGDYAAFPYLKHIKNGTADAFGLTLLDPVAATEQGEAYAYERKSETAVVVRNAAGSEWIAANRTGAAIGESVWKTDALFSFFKVSDSGLLRAAAVEGEYVRISKDLEFQFNGPATIAVESGAAGLQLYYSVANPVQGIARVSGKVYRLDLSDSGLIVFQ